MERSGSGEGRRAPSCADGAGHVRQLGPVHVRLEGDVVGVVAAQVLGRQLLPRKLKFVGVPTRDQDRALAFWTERMGFRVATDQPMGAQRWIELSIPGADTGVVLFTPEGQEDRIGAFFNGSFGCDAVE